MSRPAPSPKAILLPSKSCFETAFLCEKISAEMGLTISTRNARDAALADVDCANVAVVFLDGSTVRAQRKVNETNVLGDAGRNASAS
ncbi:MAG: hypothetical protein BJ554DRAFT_3631 [Olpidium bornovanus]|uniref:Uncharacterized protein n=1 Tax=Olpidium bornovanus TaxID=278681 RepID=A0A8H8A091_9FUNG|nr:MAG: hypothetical protein BJ554DRAFT_3631 [Olpidium bornovanus]